MKRRMKNSVRTLFSVQGVIKGVINRLKIGAIAAIFFSISSGFNVALADEAVLADDSFTPYIKTPGISGALLSVGSDTLAGTMTQWVEAFEDLYPNVDGQVQVSGSSTAPPALTEGTAQFGLMSRPMRSQELEAFERAHGYRPLALRIAIDAIGVFVHRDNPLKSLSFQQLDAIFSATLRCGENQAITTWAQLGFDYPWAQRRIQLFSRNSVSGTYGFFKQKVLCEGDFQNRVNEQPGSASVVQSVASSISAIGYSGVGFRMSGVKLLAISQDGKKAVMPTQQTILNREYPLSRYLYIYINKDPRQPLPPLQREFIRFIYSQQGQAIVAKEGYMPISAALAKRELQQAVESSDRS